MFLIVVHDWLGMTVRHPSKIEGEPTSKAVIDGGILKHELSY
jgi:hypothetical protein